jgi:hypothetical protein
MFLSYIRRNHPMKSSIMKIFVVTVALTLTGCGYTINQYGASVENVMVIKNSGAKPASVASFTSYQPGMSSIFCRGAGPVETADNSSFEAYIQKAFVDELKLAGLYDPASRIILQGKVENIDYQSNVGDGKWFISLTISSNKNSGYTVSSTYNFSTNWVADKACQQVAQAFVPAVQQLILKTFSDPRFKDLYQ